MHPDHRRLDPEIQNIAFPADSSCPGSCGSRRSGNRCHFHSGVDISCTNNANRYGVTAYHGLNSLARSASQVSMMLTRAIQQVSYGHWRTAPPASSLASATVRCKGWSRRGSRRIRMLSSCRRWPPGTTSIGRNRPSPGDAGWMPVRMRRAAAGFRRLSVHSCDLHIGVGSTNSPDEEAGIQGRQRLNGRSPIHCRPTPTD